LLGNASVEKQENLPAPPPLIETFFWDSSQRIKMSISYLFETLGLIHDQAVQMKEIKTFS